MNLVPFPIHIGTTTLYSSWYRQSSIDENQQSQPPIHRLYVNSCKATGITGQFCYCIESVLSLEESLGLQEYPIMSSTNGSQENSNSTFRTDTQRDTVSSVNSQQWRKRGQKLRAKLVESDEGAHNFVLSNDCDIEKYYKVADRVSQSSKSLRILVAVRNWSHTFVWNRTGIRAVLAPPYR
jgi:hypothetical protein